MEPRLLRVSWWHARRFTLLLAGLGILGAAIVLLRVAHGVGVSGDANYYIELARALSEGGRGLEWLSGDDSRWYLTRYPPALSAWWPPLYPALLAIFGGFAFDARSVAGPFNALAFGLTIIFTGYWLRASVRSRLLIVLGCALVAFSTPVTWMASWALSEAVFIPLTVLALLSAYKFLRSGERSALIWAAVFSALACLTRYSGVVLVLTMIPLMALQPCTALRERLRHIGVYLAISTAPLALWVLRNYLVTETFTGPRGGAGGPLVKGIARRLSDMEAWNPLAADLRALILPLERTPEWIVGGVATGVGLLALATLVAWCALRWWRDEAKSRNRGHTAITVAGVYAFGHMVFIIANAVVGNLGLSARQLIPMYIPLVVVVMVMADALLSNSDRPRCVRLASAPIVGAVVVRFPQVLVAVLAVCTSYAAYVSVRDTHTAVFNPEYGWNAKAYNAEHIDIEPMSAKDHLYGLVGDSSPVACAHFDLYLGGGALVYFKEECSREDMERGVFLYVHPTTNLALPGIHKSIGTDILNFVPTMQGINVDGECLAIAPLPEYDIKLITTGQYSRDTVYWEVDIAPAEYLKRTE